MAIYYESLEQLSDVWRKRSIEILNKILSENRYSRSRPILDAEYKLLLTRLINEKRANKLKQKRNRT